MKNRKSLKLKIFLYVLMIIIGHQSFFVPCMLGTYYIEGEVTPIHVILYLFIGIAGAILPGFYGGVMLFCDEEDNEVSATY